MKSFNYVITDEVGIHARPAGLLVNARKLMMLMSLGVKCGEEITVEVEGADEDAAAAGMEKFFEETL